MIPAPIAKVVEVYKRNRTFSQTHGAIYDERILSWKGSDRVSILTNHGRQIMPWVCGGYQQAPLDRVRGQVALGRRRRSAAHHALPGGC